MMTIAVVATLDKFGVQSCDATPYTHCCPVSTSESVIVYVADPAGMLATGSPIVAAVPAGRL